MSDQPTRTELLARAASCYGRAGLRHDALRCLELAGDWGAAALMHRQAGNLARAADCFERAANWSAAAGCHLESGRPLDAARCLTAAGEHLESAWVLAHLAQAGDRAGAQLDTLTPADRADALALDLARARTLVPRDPDQAARLLRRVTANLGEAEPGPGRDRCLRWAHLLAGEVLGRADLTAELHAAAHRAGLSDSARDWEAWAQGAFGGSEGVPETGGEEDQEADARGGATEPAA